MTNNKMSNEVKEQAVWRTYPSIDFLQANQFGEVRTVDHYVSRSNGRKQFVKGHVLKQYVNEDGYMQVEFSMNGKHINLRVHRVVATCFLLNPENLPEVNHKDNNPKNNSASNLEWCNHEYNIAYRKKYGIALNRQVFAVNLKTFKMSFFESQNEAARQLGISTGHINSVLKGRLKQTGGYWFTEDKSKVTEEKIRKIRNNARFFGGMFAVNLKTEEVSFFESQTEAAQQLGVYQTSICRVLKGRYKKTGGYWFCNADSTAIEKMRSRFGDEVVKKVEKLLH